VLRQACAYRPDDRHAQAQDLARALHELWRKLPDPPSDAPNLMTNMPPELPPPEGMAWMTPLSDHGRRGVSFRDIPSLDDATDSVPSSPPGQEIPLHDSSIIRRALLQLPPPPPPPPPPPRSRAWMVGAALVLVSLVVAAADVRWVTSAEVASEKARESFLGLARRNLPVVDELGSLGADRADLLQRYEALRDAPDAGSGSSAADAWIEALSQAAQAAASHPDGRTQTVATRRVEDLARARAGWRLAQSTWSLRAHTLPGQLVVFTGLASPAPPPDTGAGDR
jgi:hypothetical protein